MIHDTRRSSVERQGAEEPLEEVRAIAAAGNLVLFPAALRRQHSLGSGVTSQGLGRRPERVPSREFRSRSIGDGSGNPVESFEDGRLDRLAGRVEERRFRGEVQGEKAFAATDLMKGKVCKYYRRGIIACIP